ncbi:ubiquinone/menaquinone biosynthesis C-methylase UbiE [Actinokineospora baliensis]|uniref:class I SAM-dependent methyltransferase n=1 Tax=Actinokineospora baliensis TaxID=547056 RepID=UPI00195AD182|nr:class I SAM-dependent methyltransferase [Actinokineospora baliensis]MBM7770399.1 ubiquinone/menaquinone biosynthesis C-methylase UbiE [Actinokineospora baliensis]
MDPVTSRMRDVYDRHASKYAVATSSLDQFPGLDLEIRSFVHAIGATGPVLDIGCGVGRDAEYIAELGLAVVLCDVSFTMLEVARARVGASAVHGDMSALPFADRVFAGIWMCGSLIHIPRARQRSVLAEAIRVLQPGGRIAISLKEGDGEGWRVGELMDERRWFTYWRQPAVAELMISVGFREVATVPSGRGSWFIASGTRA